MRNKKAGFTLAELLIVVAVIAVLVAISIPIFTSQLEKSRKAVCIANCRSLKTELSAKYMNDETMTTSGNVNPSDADSAYAQYRCRQGGKISYSLKEGQFEVYCSKHSPHGITNAVMDSMKNIMKNESNSNGNPFIGHPIDSAAQNSNFTTAFVEALKKAGIDLAEMGIKSWSVNKAGDMIQWTTADISTMQPGDEVLIMRCRLDYKNEPYTYTVWKTEVKEKTENNSTYNYLGDAGTQITTDSADKTDIQAIKNIYNQNKGNLGEMK